jgi:hypothetical protein
MPLFDAIADSFRRVLEAQVVTPTPIHVVWADDRAYIQGVNRSPMLLTLAGLQQAVEQLGHPRDRQRAGAVVAVVSHINVLTFSVKLEGVDVGLTLEAKDIVWLG